MNCFIVKDKLHDYFDGILPEKDKEAVENHLSECIFCKKEFNKLNDLFEGIQALSKTAKYPEKILNEIYAELDKDTTKLPNIPVNLWAKPVEVKDTKPKKTISKIFSTIVKKK